MDYYLFTNISIKITILLSLIVTSGVLLIAILKIWERVFDLGLQMFHMKKEFIDFVYKKYRAKTVRPKIK